MKKLLVDELIEPAINAGIPTIKMLVSRTFIDLNRDRLELDPTMFYNYPQNKDILYDKHCRVGLGVVHRINYKREPLYKGLLDYNEVLKEYEVIVNCTPAGMYPKENLFPLLPYEALTSKNLLYDLVYNPEQTMFMKKGKASGATVKNGLEMLILQALASWEMWQS